jgi:hypothetical protein
MLHVARPSKLSYRHTRLTAGDEARPLNNPRYFPLKRLETALFSPHFSSDRGSRPFTPQQALVMADQHIDVVRDVLQLVLRSLSDWRYQDPNLHLPKEAEGTRDYES